MSEPFAPIASGQDRPRRVVLVLGMHRSGTSALARALHVLGLGLPGNLLPPAPDNTEGYFESRDLARLNERMLVAAGTAWHDPTPIPEAWFASADAQAFREPAEAFIREALVDSEIVVLKDPRLCRLLPFWRDCLARLKVDAGAVIILREPREVAQSLQARVLSPESRPAGILSVAKAHWLWLRYVLEAESGSRGLPRCALTYEMLLDDAPGQIAMIATGLGLDLAMSEATRAVLLKTLARGLKRQHAAPADSTIGWPRVAAHLYKQLAHQVVGQGEFDCRAVDAYRERFEKIQLESAAQSERSVHSYSPHFASAFLKLGRDCGTPPANRVLFVSDDPKTRGHIYRVENHVAALRSGGLEAGWCAIGEFGPPQLSGVTMVVAFRIAWDARLAAIFAACRSRGIAVAFDVDDLVFEPMYMREPYFDYVRRLNPAQRERWAEKVEGWRQSLLEADFAMVSTLPLAAAVERLDRQALVWPNGISWTMVENARQLLPRAEGNGVRLGYASGAPTHQKDFAGIVAPLTSLLRKRPDLTLTIVGHLDLTEFPELAPYASRIEQRPLVPHHELAAEYARFDVNLAPLEAGNPFCEAKSELKYFEAALVHVPTVAAATAPFAAAIRSGVNGYVARNSAEWEDCMRRLIDDEDARRRMGGEAYWHALARFGPEAQCLDGLAVVAQLASRLEPTGIRQS